MSSKLLSKSLDDWKDVMIENIVEEDQKLAEEYKCVTCYTISPTPMACKNCSVYQCPACVAQCNGKCPQCSNNTKFIEQKVRSFNNIRIKCPWADCGTIIPLGLEHKVYIDHAEKCKYRLQKCKKCFAYIKMIEYDEHQKEKCPNREYSCEFCKKPLLLKNKQDHENSQYLPCKGWNFCPNRCGKLAPKIISSQQSHNNTEKIKLSDCTENNGIFLEAQIEEHLKNCQLRPKKCKICKENIISDHFIEHVKSHSYEQIASVLSENLPITQTNNNYADIVPRQIEVRFYNNSRSAGIFCKQELQGLKPCFRTFLQLSDNNPTYKNGMYEIYFNIGSMNPLHRPAFKNMIKNYQVDNINCILVGFDENKAGLLRPRSLQKFTEDDELLYITTSKFDPAKKFYTFWVINDTAKNEMFSKTNDLTLKDTCLLFLKAIDDNNKAIFLGGYVFDKNKTIKQIIQCCELLNHTSKSNWTVKEEINAEYGIWGEYDTSKTIEELNIKNGTILVYQPDCKIPSSLKEQYSSIENTLSTYYGVNYPVLSQTIISCKPLWEHPILKSWTNTLLLTFYPDPSAGINNSNLVCIIAINRNDTYQQVYDKLRKSLSLLETDNLYLYPFTAKGTWINEKFIDVYTEMSYSIHNGIPFLTTSLMDYAMKTYNKYPIIATEYLETSKRIFKVARLSSLPCTIDNINTLLDVNTPYENSKINKILVTMCKNIIVADCDMSNYPFSAYWFPHLSSESYVSISSRKSKMGIYTIDSHKQQLAVIEKSHCKNYTYPIKCINNTYKIVGFPWSRELNKSDLSMSISMANADIDFDSGEIINVTPVEEKNFKSLKIMNNREGQFNAVIVSDEFESTCISAYSSFEQKYITSDSQQDDKIIITSANKKKSPNIIDKKQPINTKNDEGKCNTEKVTEKNISKPLNDAGKSKETSAKGSSKPQNKINISDNDIQTIIDALECNSATAKFALEVTDGHITNAIDFILSNKT